MHNLCMLAYEVRQHAVDPCGGQQQRQRREADQQRHPQPARPGIEVDQIGRRPDVRNRLLGIHGEHLFAHRATSAIRSPDAVRITRSLG